MYEKLAVQMQTMKNDEEGATALEYGLFAALIAAVIVGVVATLGTEIQGAFQAVVDAMTGA